MIVIDCMGLLCPVPVIKTKKEIEKLPPEGGVIKVLVDNALACENLGKMADKKGLKCDVVKVADKQYEVTVTVGEGQVTAEAQAPQAAPAAMVRGEGLVVAISQDKMGKVSDDLGKILIKGIIFSQSQLEFPPKAVLFFNSGVNLALEGANTLDDLKSLQEKGTQIRVCGTCVDFFNVKDKVAVGEIANMYDIVEFMDGAQKVINI